MYGSALAAFTDSFLKTYTKSLISKNYSDVRMEAPAIHKIRWECDYCKSENISTGPFKCINCGASKGLK